MAVISNNPRGLLSLLGLKDMGAVPSDLSGTVAPSLDMTPFLLLNRETFREVVSVNGTGHYYASNTMVVPPGELWFVHSYSVWSQIPAAGTIQMKPLFAENVNNPQTIGNALSGTANHLVQVEMMNTRWAVPGTQFGLMVVDQTFGPWNVACSITITRLRI